MGTRADFYVGRGASAEWLGSIAWDGYPEGIDDVVLKAACEDEFRHRVHAMLAKRDDGTTPEMGWPWPWEDSRTTDYAYAFDDGQVWCSEYGRAWFDVDVGSNYDDKTPKTAKFPDMRTRRRMPTVGDKRSGLICVGCGAEMNDEEKAQQMALEATKATALKLIPPEPLP